MSIDGTLLSADNLDFVNQHCQLIGGVVRCEVADAKGRVLVAEKDCHAGDIIYKEPLLHAVEETQTSQSFQTLLNIGKTGGCLSDALSWYWCALNSLTVSDTEGLHRPSDLEFVSEEVQKRLLLLHMPCVETVSEVALGMPQVVASLFVNEKNVCSASALEKLAHKLTRLLLAWKYNSFEDAEDPPVTSTYFLASFHSHDCSPNASWTEIGDHFALRARCEINAGEEICISYLADEDLFWPTAKRRDHLLESKAFLCNCLRCSELWDPCRSFRCTCGGMRCFPSEVIRQTTNEHVCSPCSRAACCVPQNAVAELLAQEARFVDILSKHADNSREIKFAVAQEHMCALEEHFPQHWVTDRFRAWIKDGCSTKAEAKAQGEKRLLFMQRVYSKPNSATAWVMQDVAMWTAVICGALKNPPTREAMEELKATKAMQLFEEALAILKCINGNEDQYYLHVFGHVQVIRAAASSLGIII